MSVSICMFKGPALMLGHQRDWFKSSILARKMPWGGSARSININSCTTITGTSKLKILRSAFRV